MVGREGVGSWGAVREKGFAPVLCRVGGWGAVEEGFLGSDGAVGADKAGGYGGGFVAKNEGLSMWY